MQRGTNLGRLGGYNQAVILDAIRRAHEGVARVELVELTGLSPQTISNVVRRLVDEGLVREDRKAVSGPGKPRTLLKLEVSSRFAIGIHLDPALMTLVMLRLDGEVVASARHEMPVVGQPDRTVEAMADRVRELIAETGVAREKILGIGVAAPGPIDEPRGIVVGPPMLHGWERVSLREPLHKLTGLPVLLDKDVTAAAVAELWASERTTPENFAFIYLGTGLGAGVVLQGEVLRGSSNNIGEIGHYPTQLEVPECYCGRRNCVGMALAFRTLIQQGIDAGLFPQDQDLSGLAETTAAVSRLCMMAKDGRPEAVQICDRAAGQLGAAVAHVANLLDVERIIFGGPLWDGLVDFALPRLRREIQDRFVAHAIHGVVVEGSGLGHQVGALGGACLVLDHALSPKASGLLLGSRT
ncbi:ROK family transcriptional regulator [Arthrobacter sp. I2-34]|uniref:ROK family transcriptional regulator n=1 Tax=Arthrobacter hankyongi TaxID=2904801 RepID=A0ABS9L2V5_9MICC|nr:ROK family transcriptional regulator [Arthrobacter hankyongi]MCG2621027.1 ROK family transcriptional regulator [Arthrobacter hankyongi]